ncbi:hypothetical protein V6N12_044335 [Hibiscus sabdariffa]|uniref:Uncharacterized protein n=1 Tax=Hibiscus sabdariffa TaxID=183260 RepID=A0ABR2DGY4_9ROSI
MTQQVWVPKAVVDRGKLPISPDMQLRSSDVVDPLEQGVVSEPTQVVGPFEQGVVDPLEQGVVDPMHVVDLIHVVDQMCPV